MSLADQGANELRECLRDPPLNEEAALDTTFVEHRENPVDVADDALGDRRVVVEA
jgi:hypothetical protein